MCQPAQPMLLMDFSGEREMDGDSRNQSRHVMVEQPFRILLVSEDNVRRSPLAECLLRKSLNDGNNGADARFEVSSAGTRGFAGVDMDPRTAEELRRLDACPNDFHSHVLTNEDCENADLILTSTRTERSQVLARYPKALRRTFTLMEFAQNAPRVGSRQPRTCSPSALVRLTAAARGSAPVSPYDMEDPAGSRKLHRRSADLTLAAVQAISAVLAPATPS